MSHSSSMPPENHAEIAEKIRSGEFFRESRAMYDFDVHEPMVERYFYALITALASLIFLIALVAAQGLYPLKVPAPFIVNSNDIADDLPYIKSLLRYEGDDPGEALLQFAAENYVRLREEYDISTFDRNMNGVKSQSSQEVFAEVDKLMNPRNPDSPLAMYERHSRRTISILSSKMVDGEPPAMEITYEAKVESKADVKKSRWRANISFQYSGLELDDEGGIKPFNFLVAKYQVKRLQDIK